MGNSQAAGALAVTIGAIEKLGETAMSAGDPDQAESNPLKPLADIATAPAEMLLDKYRKNFLKGLA